VTEVDKGEGSGKKKYKDEVNQGIKKSVSKLKHVKEFRINWEAGSRRGGETIPGGGKS